MLCWCEFFCVVLLSVGVKFAWFRASSGFMSVTVSMARRMGVIREHMKQANFVKSTTFVNVITKAPPWFLMIPMIRIEYLHLHSSIFLHSCK